MKVFGPKKSKMTPKSNVKIAGSKENKSCCTL